jgi:hypothetical protein
MYHLRPIPAVDLGGKDVLNHLQLLLSQIGCGANVQDPNTWVLGNPVSYSVGQQGRFGMVSRIKQELVVLGILSGPPSDYFFMARSYDPVGSYQANEGK